MYPLRAYQPNKTYKNLRKEALPALLVQAGLLL